MKARTALFDLDGTLFDTGEVNYRAYQEALAEYGFTLDHDYYVKKCNGMQYKTFLPAIVGEDSDVMEQIHHKKKAAYAGCLSMAKCNEHLFRLAEALRADYNLAVVTTASRRNTMEILEFFHKSELFDLILTQEDVSSPKPDPEGFLKAMDYFKSSGGDTLIFEDSEAGILAAKATGATVFTIAQF